jgi:hypothetical protein
MKPYIPDSLVVGPLWTLSEPVLEVGKKSQNKVVLRITIKVHLDLMDLGLFMH